MPTSFTVSLQHLEQGSDTVGAQEITNILSSTLRLLASFSRAPGPPSPLVPPNRESPPTSTLVLPPASHRHSAAHPPPGPGNCGWARRLRSTAHLRGHPRRSAGPRRPRPGVSAMPPLRFRPPGCAAVRTPAQLRDAQDSVLNGPLLWEENVTRGSGCLR